MNNVLILPMFDYFAMFIGIQIALLRISHRSVSVASHANAIAVGRMHRNLHEVRTSEPICLPANDKIFSCQMIGT